MNRCRECNMSLLSLEVVGVGHDPETKICYNCDLPFVDADLVSEDDAVEYISIDIDI